MKYMVIQHIESEGPGSLGSYLLARGHTLETIHLYNGDTLPPDATGYRAVISLGGPMNVYEEEKYPFLKAETDFLRNMVNAGTPVLGICLGAQMIAKAQGAEVCKSPKKEVGWCTIRLTDSGLKDALFQGLPSALEVLQWHEDMFHIPDNGLLLAQSADCPHQAFRYKNAYGLQFHVEITKEMLSDWFSDSPELQTILTRFDQVESEFSKCAESIFENFLRIVP